MDFQVKADGWCLDDLLVQFSVQNQCLRWAVSVRSSQQITSGVSGDFVRAAWAELLGQSGSDFNPDADLVGLVIPPLHRDTKTRLDDLVRKARQQDPADLDRRIGRSGYVSVEKRALWNSCRGPDDAEDMSASPGELLKRFRCLELDLLNVDSLARDKAVEWCEEAMLPPGDGENLWDSLVKEVQTVRTAGGFIDGARLVRRLGARYPLRTDTDSDRGGCLQDPPAGGLVEILRATGIDADTGHDLDREMVALPPNCREHIETLGKWSPSTARRLVNLLSNPSSRTTGVLARIATHPPSWLVESSAVAWEALGCFISAHDLKGAELVWQKAIEAGSAQSPLYLIRLATNAADADKREEAKMWLSQVPSDYPLLPAVREFIKDNPAAVADAVKTAGLLAAEDSHLARRSLAILMWAYVKLKEYKSLREVLRSANQRFPDRAWLLLNQALSTVDMVNSQRLEGADSHALLTEAADLALRARDCFRLWNGPSQHAVAFVTSVALARNDPQTVVGLASPEPEGEATASEANHPDVRRNLAEAYLMLNRASHIDASLIEGINPAERAWIRAVQALLSEDETAPSLMREAVAQANDEGNRRRALFGLAATGDLDEAAMAEVSESDVALFRGTAALSRGETADAINVLTPYRFESAAHAFYLAQAQARKGRLEEAADTLTDAAQHLDDLSLYVDAAVLKAELGKLAEAQSMATDALSRMPYRMERHRLRSLLVGVAQQLQDWQRMQSFARALVEEFPDDERGAWMLVYALHRQGRNQQAWDYITGRDLIPSDQETAKLAITVWRGVDPPNEAASRLLDIADSHTDSEEVIATALIALMTAGDKVKPTDQERVRISELREDFFARYPQSHILQVHSVEDPEEIAEMMASWLTPRYEQINSLIEKVQYGQLPYGVLLRVRELPYAQVLASLAAGCLTAIPFDKDRRDRERGAAKRALGGKVAVDTSVALVGSVLGLDTHRLSRVFKAVLAADELIADARIAVASAREPVAGFAFHDPALDQIVISEISEEQHRALIQKTESVLQILSGWQRVSSGPLPPPRELGGAEESLRPWDASIRVALSTEGGALWCDDVALRGAAESVGIPSFGTWALYEELSTTHQHEWLPDPTALKMRLLRAGVADVPISLGELGRAADSREEPDIAVELFLRRPYVWSDRPINTLRWYLQRVKVMREGPHRKRVPMLLYQASYGWGTAVSDADRNAVISDVLGKTVLLVNDPAITPTLLGASRYAAKELSPTTRPDPLRDAAKKMVKILEASSAAGPAAQTVIRLFSEADPADRLIVTSVVLSA
ncbi:MAG: hypothetical protein OXS33_09795 [bacterium]|nr:hypothetical protein [bacterium]